MLNLIRDFFDRHIGAPAPAEAPHSIELATAALLVEMARIDRDATDAERTAVLLVNLGTPDEPTAAALRRYLAEFLWDPRVVEIPQLQGI